MLAARMTSGKSLQLVAVSAAALLLELAFIRYANSTVQILAYFTNFLLISAFLGLGVGSLMRTRAILLDVFPWLAALVVVVLGLLDGFGFDHSFDEQVLFPLMLPGRSMPVWLAVTVVFGLNTLLFVPLGNRLGQLLGEFPDRLTAYGYDLAGSLSGVILFAALCALFSPPWVWMAVGALLTLVAMDGPSSRRWRAALGFALAVAATFIPDRGLWSPYYRVQVMEARGPQGEEFGYGILVNKVRIQDSLHFTDTLMATHMRTWVDYYNLPYGLTKPRSVLVLGGGSGNDATIALAHGVEKVTVVEIDPVILSFGFSLHPHRPYRDPRVRVVNDDARAFLRRTDETFDLIVMNALDSHLQLPGLSTLRLESYMYTTEAFADARRLMHPGSLLMVHLSSGREWIGRRFYWSLARAFEREPELYWTPNSPFASVAFVYGPPEVLARAPTPPIERAPEATRADYRSARDTIDLATDDWPHIYMSGRFVPRVYQGVLVAVVLLAAGLVFSLGRPVGTSATLHFMLLGTGFMLLETRSITQIALLFGATWIVNAIVIGFILLCVAIGNALVLGGWTPPPATCWGLLFTSLLLGYVVPLELVLAAPFWARIVLAGSWTALPVLFASLLFSLSFRRTANPSGAFGANLLGVVLGGVAEYASMVLGLNALYLVALGVYVLALVAGRAWDRSGTALPVPSPAA
jgi:spermidine synthase